MEIDEDRLDGPLEAGLSLCASDIMDVELASRFSRHLREKDGNRVPILVASPLIGES